MNLPVPPDPIADGLSPQEWHSLLDDDELAPKLVEHTLTRTQPTPAWMMSIAEQAFLTRDLEAELAELLSDEASVGARAVDVDQRAVVFGHGLLRLELSIRAGSDGAVIDGIVSGELQLLGWEDPAGRRRSVSVDRFGRFVIEAGRSVRVRMRAASGGSTIITPWVVLA